MVLVTRAQSTLTEKFEIVREMIHMLRFFVITSCICHSSCYKLLKEHLQNHHRLKDRNKLRGLFPLEYPTLKEAKFILQLPVIHRLMWENNEVYHYLHWPSLQ